MSSRRILIFGNSGSGKSTLARSLSAELGIPHLDLDSVAWKEAGVRRPLEESVAAIERFVAASEGWVVEGCYGDLLDRVADRASELHFLNPGVEGCVAGCRARPWEPHKYPNLEEQNRMLEMLIAWVREYETRTDEFSLARHRALFDRFPGEKHEITAASRTDRSLPGSPLVAAVALLATFALGACVTVPEGNGGWVRQPGWILDDASLGATIEMPDTVRRGAPVAATVVTRGSSSCTRPAGAEVAGGGLEVRVTPMDSVAPPGTPCTRDLAAFPRIVELRFATAGEARVVVVGRASPEGERVEVTRRVVVIP